MDRYLYTDRPDSGNYGGSSPLEDAVRVGVVSTVRALLEHARGVVEERPSMEPDRVAWVNYAGNNRTLFTLYYPSYTTHYAGNNRTLHSLLPIIHHTLTDVHSGKNRTLFTLYYYPSYTTHGNNRTLHSLLLPIIHHTLTDVHWQQPHSPLFTTHHTPHTY
jgi:hypothetical protein